MDLDVTGDPARRRPEMKRWAARGVMLLGLVAWVAIPAIGLSRVRGEATDTVLRGRVPAWAPARASTEDVTIGRALHLHWEARSPVVAPAWSGVLAQLTVKPGDHVVDGEVVAVVDQVKRTLVASRRPFTRPLALGATGDDVADLNTFLRRHGFEADKGSTFANATWRGVNKFSASIGMAPTPVFDPSWVLYLSAPEATVATVAGTVGAPAPGAGETILSLVPHLVSARVIPVQPELAPSQDQGSSDPSASGGDGSGADAAAAAALDQRLAAVHAVAVPNGSVLEAGDGKLALDQARTAVTASSLAAAAALVDGQGAYVEVTVATPPAPNQIDIPAAAVFADDAGRSCVLVRRSGRSMGIPVEIIGGSAARTSVAGKVSGSLEVGDRVAVDVAAQDRTCR